jgi:hypothetical protein
MMLLLIDVLYDVAAAAVVVILKIDYVPTTISHRMLRNMHRF